MQYYEGKNCFRKELILSSKKKSKWCIFTTYWSKIELKTVYACRRPFLPENKYWEAAGCFP